MSQILNTLPRMMQRAALLSMAALAMLLLAGAHGSPQGTSEPREGGGEESVHAANEYAGALNRLLASGADDGAPDALPPTRDALALATYVATSGGLSVHADVAPTAPYRARPAARGPPLLG